MYNDDKEFQDKLVDFETLTQSDSIQTPQQFYDTVQRYQSKIVGILKKQTRHKIIAIEKDIEMPLYLWIGDEREAIFSIPFDKSTGSVHEHSFITKDPDLIRALRATWERYSELVQPNNSV